MHGMVLGTLLLLVQPLYDFLKVALHQLNFNIFVDEEKDPIAGKFTLLYGDQYDAYYKNLESGEDPMNQQFLLQIQNDGHNNPNFNSNNNNALVLSSANALTTQSQTKMDPLLELADGTHTAVECVARLSHFFPFLASKFSGNVVNIFPTRILILLNVFDEEEIVHDESYYTLRHDIEQEVEKYGRVEELIIPRRTAAPRAPEKPKKEHYLDENEELDDEKYTAAVEHYQTLKLKFDKDFDHFLEQQGHPVYGGYGRIFIVYATAEEAALVQAELNGKLYNNRTVITSFLFEDLLLEENKEDKEEEKVEAD
ncbi:hypothetical protein, conserved [Angomonas deanei]|uniref:RRM domain-containing protein n=1 Tax=Angomonas deanei TaxID=59799 RepID=A0A7G2CTP4_9TRYP|nr:hypothetical protein, conserved [Angomonas deanei]